MKRKQFSWIAALVVGVFLIVRLVFLERVAGPTTTIVILVAIAAVIAAYFIGLALLYRSRRQALLAAHPDARVLIARTNRELTATIKREKLVDPAGPLGSGLSYLFGVVADSTGVRFYTGTRSALLLFEVPWSHVVSIDIATVATTQLADAPAISLRVHSDSGDISLPFSVVRDTETGLWARNDAEIEALAAELRVLSGSPRVQSFALESAFAPMRRHQLLPGIPASSFARLRPWLFGAGTIVFFVFGFGIALFGVPFSGRLDGIIAGFVLMAIGYATFFIAQLRGKKEVAAGYTTMNGLNPSLDQVDPLTGVVIREAGAPYLTKQELATARERARMVN